MLNKLEVFFPYFVMASLKLTAETNYLQGSAHVAKIAVHLPFQSSAYFGW